MIINSNLLNQLKIIRGDRMIKNVMLVDDSAFMRTIIKNVLVKNGYSIVGEAENGKIAVDLYSKLKPDVVFMDVVMPEMNGIESVKNIKANDPNAKIIMCSSSGQQAVVMEAINAGARGFITKPFQEAKILDELSRAET